MRITIISGGGPAGANLVGYYFELVTGSTTEYNFYDPNGNLVVTDPSQFTNGQKFFFDLVIGSTTYKWEIKNYDLTATPPHGDWRTNDPEGGHGTWIAQAGTEEEAKGKTA